jgi:hypothetical protein
MTNTRPDQKRCKEYGMTRSYTWMNGSWITDKSN